MLTAVVAVSMPISGQAAPEVIHLAGRVPPDGVVNVRLQELR
jgi:hypothetical protein